MRTRLGSLFVVILGGAAVVTTGCGRDSVASHNDAAVAPISSGGIVATGGSEGSGGATVTSGSGGSASGGATGTIPSGTGGAGVGGVIGHGGAVTGGVSGAGGSCNGAAKSSLPGVSFVFSDGPCSFTLAEAAAGISLSYELRVERSLDGVHPEPLDYGSCGQPDETGLIVGFEIAGTGGRYCLCDVGPCSRRTFSTHVPAATYPMSIAWDGRSWMGPSDTNSHEGAALPTGTYTLTVTSKGTWDGPGSCDAGACSADGGAVLDYQVTAERFITITP